MNKTFPDRVCEALDPDLLRFAIGRLSESTLRVDKHIANRLKKKMALEHKLFASPELAHLVEVTP